MEFEKKSRQITTDDGVFAENPYRCVGNLASQEEVEAAFAHCIKKEKTLPTKGKSCEIIRS